MEKKFYLKPDTEVLEFETEYMIAATIEGGGSYGDGSDVYHFITDGSEGENAGDID